MYQQSYSLNVLVILIILYIVNHLQQNVKSMQYLYHLTFCCGAKLKKWDTAVIINPLGQSTYLIWFESPNMVHSREEVWSSIWSHTTYSTPPSGRVWSNFLRVGERRVAFGFILLPPYLVGYGLIL